MARAHLTAAEFVEAYPEFASANETTPALVAAALSAAALETSLETCGELASVVHGLRAAQWLALGPWGRDARLASDDGSTVYDGRLERLTLAIGASGAPRVI